MTEFRKLWIGETISAVGSAVTLVALPLTAALTLSATPEQMGLLTGAGWFPYLVLGLFAGAWADRLRRRPILIATDLARALILVTIPAAALLDVLTIGHVLVAALLTSAMTVLFRAAYNPFLPVVVERPDLVRANARLQMSEAFARVAGPSVGGLLVQIFTAPIAILLDALSFLASAVAIAAMRVTETLPPRADRRSIWSEIAEGVRVAVRHRFVRPVMIIGLLFNFAITLGDASYVLYATRELGLGGALFGAVFAVGGVTSAIGALIVGRLTRRFGIGPTMFGAILLFPLAGALILVANGPPPVAALYLAGRTAVTSGCAAVFNVTSTSVYQTVVPSRYLGRVGGANQVLGLGLSTVSSVLGGWLGGTIGLWNTLAISVGGQFLALLYVAFSPLRTFRSSEDLETQPGR